MVTARFGVVLLVLMATDAAAEEPAAQPLTLEAYLAAVARSNLDLAAQRLNVPIAQAQIYVAKVFPEPVLSGGLASLDTTNHGAPTAWDIGLSQTLELGGKRGARVDVATKQYEQSQADLDDFFRTLRGTATNDFIEALRTRLALTRRRLTLASFERLVKVNEERLRAGDIGQVALLQSRVEARRFNGEVLAAEGDAEVARLALGIRMGSSPGSGVVPQGELGIATRTFDDAALLERAKSVRPDLRSKRLALEVARAKSSLAHANRWEDVTLNFGFLRTLTGTGDFAQPPFSSISAGLSIPIPLARIYRGELDATDAGVTQGEFAARQTELAVETDVRQALTRYRAAVERIRLYTGGVLADADKVAEATLFSYQRGSATLLEVLDSQRTVNEVYLAYYDALAEHAKALVAVEQAAALWQIHLEEPAKTP
jgi:outer membrane protein, heavy metal efflux system